MLPWCGEIDPDRYRENLHFVNCKIRDSERGKGCERCEKVKKRIPDDGKFGRSWNQIVY